MVESFCFWFLFTGRSIISDELEDVTDAEPGRKKKERVKKPPNSMRVFDFHSFAPETGGRALHYQFLLTSRYSNGLVANNLKARERYNTAKTQRAIELAAVDPTFASIEFDIARLDGEIKGLTIQIDELTEFVRAEHQRRRTKRCKFPEKTTLRIKKDLRKNLKQQLSVLTKVIKPTEKQQEQLDAQRLEDQRELNHEFSRLGLDWGARAIANLSIGNLMRSKTPPSFKRFNTRQRLHVGHQIQHRLTWGQLCSPNHQCWIDKSINANDHKTSRRGQRRPIYTVHMRIGEAIEGGTEDATILKKSSYDWVTFKTIFHDIDRIQPTDIVRFVRFSRVKIGHRQRWKLQLVVERPETFNEPRDVHGFVGFDLGYRKKPDGSIRAAYWYGSDGCHGEVVIPELLLSAYRWAEQQQSTRDTNFDTIRGELVAWLKRNGTPLHWKARLDSLSSWKSPARLQEFVSWLNVSRLDEPSRRADNDELIFEKLHAWVKVERRLYSAEMHARESFKNARNESYKLLAHQLATRYRTLVLEDLDLVKLAKAPGDEAEGGPNSTAREQKSRAAIGNLRDSLLAKFSNHVWVDPAGTSKTCSQCLAYYRDFGSSPVFDVCSCPSIDRDLNAAINIVRVGCETSGDLQFMATPRGCCEITTCGGTNHRRLRGRGYQTGTSRNIDDNWVSDLLLQ